MRRAIPPLHQNAFMAWCLVKHRDNFTFTFFFKTESWMFRNVYRMKKVVYHFKNCRIIYIYIYIYVVERCDSSVGIATRLRVGRPGFDFRQRRWFFLIPTASRTAPGLTQSPNQWVPETCSPGAKRPGREADQLLPSIAEVRNAWSYTSSPQYVFMAWCLIKQWLQVQGQLHLHI
jgi:hypothetical protein